MKEEKKNEWVMCKRKAKFLCISVPKVDFQSSGDIDRDVMLRINSRSMKRWQVIAVTCDPRMPRKLKSWLQSWVGTVWLGLDTLFIIHLTIRVVNMKVRGWKDRRKPKKRWMDYITEHMKKKGMNDRLQERMEEIVVVRWPKIIGINRMKKKIWI